MPPKIKVEKEDILAAAIELVRTQGIEELNARSLAKKIGCSVQPLYRAYASMENLKAAVYETVENLYNQIMMESLENDTDAFLSMGLAYIHFAQKEKNFFKLLFMADAFENANVASIAGSTKGDDDVISVIVSMTGLNALYAQELYTGIWLTTHGIASLMATNNCLLTDGEIKNILQHTFTGLQNILTEEMEKQ